LKRGLSPIVDECRKSSELFSLIPAVPAKVKQLTPPVPATGTYVQTMTGNIALLTENVSQSVNSPKSISTSHPITVRRFDKAFAFRKDSGGIIYIASADGQWILKLTEAPDKSARAAYLDYILYGTR